MGIMITEEIKITNQIKKDIDKIIKEKNIVLIDYKDYLDIIKKLPIWEIINSYIETDYKKLREWSVDHYFYIEYAVNNPKNAYMLGKVGSFHDYITHAQFIYFKKLTYTAIRELHDKAYCEKFGISP